MQLVANYELCVKQIACDGTFLRAKRRELGICVACEKALSRRGKMIGPRGVVKQPRVEGR